MGDAFDDNADWGALAEVGLNDRVRLVGEDRYYRTKVADDTLPEALAEAINSYAESFASWIYHSLDDESMYRYSDEYVDENILANGILFDEFGSMI